MRCFERKTILCSPNLFPLDKSKLGIILPSSYKRVCSYEDHEDNNNVDDNNNNVEDKNNKDNVDNDKTN